MIKIEKKKQFLIIFFHTKNLFNQTLQVHILTYTKFITKKVEIHFIERREKSTISQYLTQIILLMQYVGQ